MRLAAAERPRADRRVWHELTEGWRYIVRSTPIRRLLIFLGAIGVLSAPYSVLNPSWRDTCWVAERTRWDS